MWQKFARMGLNGFIFKKINKNEDIETKTKSWEPFRSCLLNSQCWTKGRSFMAVAEDLGPVATTTVAEV